MLSLQGGLLALLMLGPFVRLVLATFLTESPAGFRDVCSRGVSAIDEDESPGFRGPQLHEPNRKGPARGVVP